MSASFRDDLLYPNLSNCQIRVVGAGATTRPPVQLPREIREAASALPISSNGGNSLDDFRLDKSLRIGREFLSIYLPTTEFAFFP